MSEISSILKLPLIKNTGILKGIPLSVRIVNQLLSTLVEKKSKYIVLLKVSRKSQDVKDETLNWLNEQVEISTKTMTIDRGKQISKWK